MRNETLNDDASGDSVKSSDVMEKLGAYVDGELSPAERESIETLLERDKSCREVVQSFRFLDDTARRDTVPSVDAEEWARIWDSIQREKDLPVTSPVPASPRGGEIIHGRWLYRLAAAAAVIALAFVGFQMTQPTDTGNEIVVSPEEQLDIGEPDEDRGDSIAVIDGDVPDEISENGVKYHDF